MKNYASIYKNEDSLSVCLPIDQDKLLTIKDKIKQINEEARMNGYNWDAFLNYYLGKYHKEILENMETDPEAGMYVAYYDLSAENEQKAERFADIIEDLIENEETIYDIVKNAGSDIEWK